MKNQSPLPFAATEDGELYILVQCAGIHPLIIEDEKDLQNYRFEGNQGGYFLADVVLNWHEKELQTSDRGHQEIVDLIKKVKSNISKKKVTYTDTNLPDE